MDLRPLSKDRLETVRDQYRSRLAIPVIPDFHDALCQMGQPYSIEDVGRTLGYVIFTEASVAPELGPTISEFSLDVRPTKHARRLFEAIIGKLKPATIIGRTDDPHWFPLLMDLRIRNTIAASLYLVEGEPNWSRDDELDVVESTHDHAPELLPLYASVPPAQGGLPDEMALTKSLVLWKHYRLMVQGKIAAVSYVVPHVRKYVTVVTIVQASMRGRGFGRYLTAYVMQKELQENKLIVAVNDSENELACRLLESLGARLAGHFVYFQP